MGLAAAPIDRIAKKRMTDRRHVDPDLVSPAGFERTFDQGGIAQNFQPLPVRDRALAAAAFDDGDLLAVGGRARQRRVDRAFARLRNAGDTRQIAADDRKGGKLLRHALVGDVGLGDDQQPRRALVDAVNDPWPGNAADSRQRFTTMVK